MCKFLCREAAMTCINDQGLTNFIWECYISYSPLISVAPGSLQTQAVSFNG